MDLTKKLLERGGYSVYCSLGLDGVKELLIEHSPDGILLENEFAGEEGFDYCRELQKESAIPILFLSNDRDEELPALQAGASDFVKKPFDFEILKARINAVLNTKDNFTAADKTDDINGTDLIIQKDKNIKSRPETADGANEANKANEANEFVKEKKVDTKRLYMVAAAFFAFIFITAGLLGTLNKNPLYDIDDLQVPLAGAQFLQPDENAKPCAEHSADYPKYLIPAYDTIFCSADTTEAQMLLLNPEGNAYCFSFEIISAETNETLYISDLVRPGMCIENFELTKVLEKGEHKAVLIVSAYESVSRSVVTETRSKFTIIVV